MSKTPLQEVLSYSTARRENRLNAAQWILEHPESMEELLKYTMEPHKDLSVKASWALEFVYIERPEELWPYLDFFFNNFRRPTNDSIVRPISHICERICISNYKKEDPALQDSFTQQHKEKLIDAAFDWLITDQKVACQVRAMTCLFHLGTEFDWIHEELKQILLKNMHSGSGGYISRGRKTLDEIRKYRSK